MNTAHAKLFFNVVLLCLISMFVNSAHAVMSFDANVTNNVIYGSGNTNGSFTLDRTNGIELGLRAKVRFDAAKLNWPRHGKSGVVPAPTSSSLLTASLHCGILATKFEVVGLLTSPTLNFRVSNRNGPIPGHGQSTRLRPIDGQNQMRRLRNTDLDFATNAPIIPPNLNQLTSVPESASIQIYAVTKATIPILKRDLIKIPRTVILFADDRLFPQK